VPKNGHATVTKIEKLRTHVEKFTASKKCYNNNNNNTSICKAHNVSIRAESEAPTVARWRGWLDG